MPRRSSPTGAGLPAHAGVPAGAAVKADGYGLGARETTEALIKAGCRDFFVSTWAEAEALGNLPEEVSLVVLHGVGPEDGDAALRLPARPCLNTRRAGRALEGDRSGARVRRDGRHRHQPAGAEADRDRRARRAAHRHAAQSSRLRGRGYGDERDAARTFSGGRVSGPGKALRVRQQRRHLPWPRL